MKLSMWMIANRLSAMDMETELSEDAGVTLNSARLAYATNCVHIYAEGSDVVCKGDGGTLRFRNMDLRTGFEVVQSVFDYFEDWKSCMQEDINALNFQAAISLAWQVLRNPLVLFDGNNRVLGITRQYSPDALDVEWSYLSRFGYSSLDAVRSLRRSSRPMTLLRKSAVPGVVAADTAQVNYGSATFALSWGDMNCGRLTILSSERPLNPGDYQLMELLVQMLEPALGQMSYRSEKSSAVDVFLNLLLGKPYGEDQLSARLRYTAWSAEELYYLCVLRMEGEEEGPELYTGQLRSILQSNIYNTVALKNEGDLILLSTRDLSRDPAALEVLARLREKNSLRMGFSIASRGIVGIGALYAQTRYALARFDWSSGLPFCRFFDLAIDYMLEMPLGQAVSAVMPSVQALWQECRGGDDLVNTLRCYLRNNCSAVKTAGDLYIHRNTVLYRVQKAEEQLGLDFHRCYDRSYFLIAVKILELNSRF